MTKANQCKSCGAPISWVKMSSGKFLRIDAEPSDAGNLRILPGGSAEVMNFTELGSVVGPRYTSHFATCPGAASSAREGERLRKK